MRKFIRHPNLRFLASCIVIFVLSAYGSGSGAASSVTLFAKGGAKGPPPPPPTTTGSIDSIISAMPSNSWKALTGTQMKDVCPLPYNSYACESVVAAWSGGAYDAVRDRMVIYGGGIPTPGTTIYSYLT